MTQDVTTLESPLLPISAVASGTVNHDLLTKLSCHTGFINEVAALAEQDTTSQKPVIERVEAILNGRQKRSKFAQAISELTDEELQDLAVVIASPRLLKTLKNYFKTPHHGIQYYTLIKELSDRKLVVPKR